MVVWFQNSLLLTLFTLYPPVISYSYINPKVAFWLHTADLLLPAHLVVEVVELLEEVVDLAALVIPLSGGEHPHLGLQGQVLTDVGDREHQLLHAAVMTHNLDGMWILLLVADGGGTDC